MTISDFNLAYPYENDLKKTLSQLTSTHVADAACKDKDFWKEGSHIPVTAMFADIHGFSEFTQRHSPADVVKTLNGYQAILNDCAVEEDGFLNKFLGDGVLLIFGVLKPKKNHASAAINAALKAMRRTNELNLLRERCKLETFHLRFGISSGPVFAGCVGTAERAEYTCIGHTVNVASRLEEIARPGEILIDQGSVELLDNTTGLVEFPPRMLRGMQGHHRTYSIALKSALTNPNRLIA